MQCYFSCDDPVVSEVVLGGGLLPVSSVWLVAGHIEARFPPTSNSLVEAFFSSMNHHSCNGG